MIFLPTSTYDFLFFSPARSFLPHEGLKGGVRSRTHSFRPGHLDFGRSPMPGVPPQGRRGRRDAWGGGVGGQCWRRMLKGMASPSGPVWVAGSCIVRLAAKGAWAAWVSNADHLAMDAWMAAGRRAWGTALLLACARRRRKSAASSLHRPPTSMANTTRRQRSPRTSSGYVRSFACLAARRAGEPGWRPCRPGSPVLVKGETRVVSTATFWHFFSPVRSV